MIPSIAKLKLSMIEGGWRRGAHRARMRALARLHRRRRGREPSRCSRPWTSGDSPVVAYDLRAQHDVARARAARRAAARPGRSGNESTSVGLVDPRGARASGYAHLVGDDERDPEVAVVDPLGAEHVPRQRGGAGLVAAMRRSGSTTSTSIITATRRRSRSPRRGACTPRRSAARACGGRRPRDRTRRSRSRRAQRRMSRTWIRPEACSRGRSICVTSPVTTILEPNPSRVRNICICSGVVFWASSRITNESLSVRPRMKASGATSIVPRSMNAFSRSASIVSYSASNSGRMYGSTLASTSPGRNPSRSPASTAGRVRMMRPTSLSESAFTASAIARYVLPVPAGPIPNVTVERADRVDVALLRHRLRRDLLAAVTPDDVVEHVADVLRLVERGDDGADGVRTDRVPALDQLDELVDDRPRLGDARLVAVERQPVAAQRDRAAEAFPQRVEHAVGDAGQLGGDLVRNGEHVLHGLSVGRCDRRSTGVSTAMPTGYGACMGRKSSSSPRSSTRSLSRGDCSATTWTSSRSSSPSSSSRSSTGSRTTSGRAPAPRRRPSGLPPHSPVRPSRPRPASPTPRSPSRMRLAVFPADEIVLVMRPEDDQTWLEDDTQLEGRPLTACRSAACASPRHNALAAPDGALRRRL